MKLNADIFGTNYEFDCGGAWAGAGLYKLRRASKLEVGAGVAVGSGD